MAMAQVSSMPKFVARCLEEIGLEGRCGIPLRDVFDLQDPSGDVMYRRYAWTVLRSMRQQLRFHRMRRVREPLAAPAASVKSKSSGRRHEPPRAQEPAKRSPRKDDAAVSGGDCSPTSPLRVRKRKWSTTLCHTSDTDADNAHVQQVHNAVDSLSSPQQLTLKRSRGAIRPRRPSESSTDQDSRPASCADQRSSPSAMIKAERRRRRASSRATGNDLHSDAQDQRTSSEPPASQHSSSEDGDSDLVPRILRSPRGYVLGKEIDVSSMRYEDAVEETSRGVLGVVASEQLRLQYLGVSDFTSIDTQSLQFDLLELIGRARVQGENAAVLASGHQFGNARQLHYLMDVLLANGLIVKNIVTADHRRFNTVHLTRFFSEFHPSMVSPTATLEKEDFPKHLLPRVIAEMIQARGERTVVFADIGRELGYDKRQQEKLRKYFFHQMHLTRHFPLELFMARCKTGTIKSGRKLWCIRLRQPATRIGSQSFGQDGSGTESISGPVLERGVMEQFFASIQGRKHLGATIPEVRELLGVPTFKLPYKLAQSLISNYNMSVEQVVVGKSTMYRMFVPDGKSLTEMIAERDSALQEFPAEVEVPEGSSIQPSTLKQATHGLLVVSTLEKRRSYIMERVEREKIVSVHHLRTSLIEKERPSNLEGGDWSEIDIRSVRRILDELEAAKSLVSMDIALPRKHVLQKKARVIKCVALPACQRDRTAISAFIEDYLEGQRKKYIADMGVHDNDSIIVVSKRRRPNVKTETETTEAREVVTYSAASYKQARVQLVKLNKQSRRLGMFFGIVYRCRVFHTMLWERVPTLLSLEGNGHHTTTNTEPGDAELASTSPGSSRHDGKGNLVFALKEVLDSLSVEEYIQVVGVNEILAETEEARVQMAITKKESWKALNQQIMHKLRGCEADRFSRILRILIELGLIQVVEDSSHSIFNMFRSSEDFDSAVSQVAFATLSGGLFKLKKHVHIGVKRGTKVLKRLPSKYSYAYAAGFSNKNNSEQLSGRIPLHFSFDGADEAMEYWKALRFLSVEGARLGNGAKDDASISANMESELVRSVPLIDHNIHSVRVWIPHAMVTPSLPVARANAIAEISGVTRGTKRKRFYNTLLRQSERSQKRTKLAQVQAEEILAARNESSNNAGITKFRKLVGAKTSLRASKWTIDQDLKLVDLYIEKLSCQWFIDVPLALQRHDERVAFRTPALSRTNISWKLMAKAMNKKPTDCALRVKELMMAPPVRSRVEAAKMRVMQLKNPGGLFYEEHEIMVKPRLTALLCRALQIIFHERASYYTVLADMLISYWNEREVKLVWRYLWLAGLITRTKKANEGKHQKERGFCIHSRVHEMKSLKIPHYPMATFSEAAEYLSFLQENVDEVVQVQDEADDREEDSDSFFEHEIGSNASAGQAVIELSSMIIGRSAMYPEYVEPPERGPDVERAAAVKGLAGHLSKVCDGAVPDDFLKEYWIVKSQFRAVSDGKSDGVVSTQIKELEAFSTLESIPSGQRGKSDANDVIRLKSWLSSALVAAGGDGLSFPQLQAKLLNSQLLDAARNSKTQLSLLLKTQLKALVQAGDAFEVNGYAHTRYVAKDNAQIWTLNPYRISDESTKEKVHFVFDKTNTMVSRPWLHLDGSVNTKVALSIKRKVTNIVMCCPGIPDRTIHRKMHKVLTLQDLRSLMDELIADEIVYARLVRQTWSSSSSGLFARSKPSQSCSLIAASPGASRHIDSERDRLHYFPSVNCVELLGALACDDDAGQEDHR